MSARNSRRQSARFTIPAQLQAPGMAPAMAPMAPMAAQPWVQPGYVAAQVAQYQAPAPAAYAAPRDPLYASGPQWPAWQQGKPIIITPTDPNNANVVRLNPRTKKPAIALLNPVDGERKREYILSHTKKGAELRNQYAQLYAPFAAVLPAVGVSRSRNGGVSRRTPSLNGQTIQFLNPTDSFVDPASGQTLGTLITFGGSSYNRLLPAWAGSQDFAERLYFNLSQVNPQLAQYVLNDINNRRIGQYIQNPRGTATGRRGNLIKVGSQTYNELLVTGFAQQVNTAPTISEAQVNADRLQNKAFKAQARQAQANLPQVSITNPETGRTFIQVGGPTFNALLNGPYEAEVRARARAVGFNDQDLDQLKASGIQRSNSTRGRASARSSAGRTGRGPAIQAASTTRLSNPAGSIQVPAQQFQYQQPAAQPTAQRLSAVQPFSQPVQPTVSVAPAQQLPQVPFQQVSPERTLVPGGPFVNRTPNGTLIQPLSPGALARQQAANADIF